MPFFFFSFCQYTFFLATGPVVAEQPWTERTQFQKKKKKNQGIVPISSDVVNFSIAIAVESLEVLK